MAVLDPIKVVTTILLEKKNNLMLKIIKKMRLLGLEKHFSRELYIEREKIFSGATKVFFRLVMKFA
jgi:hypothetical protein